MTLSAPLVVVGSVNADIYVEIDKLPKESETIVAKSGHTFAGGKGANQAACAARLSYPTYLVAQVGKDGHASLVKDALASAGVRLDHMNTVKASTGHAVVMLQPGGINSIVLVQGANVSWPRLEDGIGRLTTTVQQLIRRAGAVLLQREVPDSVNLEAAKIARSANVPVVLDAGGADTPIAQELLKCVAVLRVNEAELARLTGLPTCDLEQITVAAMSVHQLGVKQVLVRLGELAGVLLFQKEHPLLTQSSIQPPAIIDTSGADDSFTAAYVVALIERQVTAEALRFAAAAESLCVRGKGTIPSMPERKTLQQYLKDHVPAAVRAENDHPNENPMLILKEHSPFGNENDSTSGVEKLKPNEDLSVTT
ncbi:hypothetical protein M758_1G038500 [Ceratodon purpureus]|nr:hypothetical protein M758_1G038500 [Ceratodon purpureus]KAG0628597.1 hypothetical protein M758_1G038500 [Ceratodon purpureus]